jgi:hypothetical protein
MSEQKPDRLFVPDKDPAFVYRWINVTAGPQGDQNSYISQWEGWEPAPLDPTKVPQAVLNATGQSTNDPISSTVNRRGDLALFRMPRERFERTVAAETKAARERQESTLDTMVLQAQENAARALRNRGQSRVPGNLVFREDVGDPI